MKVLGLVASPRKGSNTDLLVDAVLRGASSTGHLTEKIYLYDVDIKPCIDCRTCKKANHTCMIVDGMTPLYSKLQNADTIIFGTPLYWYGPSAKMKLLVDRLRPFVESKKLRGKKTVLVVPSEEGAEACTLTVSMFYLSFKYLEMELANVLLPKASERAEIKNQPHIIAEAFDAGKKLA
ncbi:MAG: flavodoxin family protein [Betaproteobacteria bacterium]